jgi:hypothetical protein
MVMGDAGDAAEDGDDVDCIVHIRAPVSVCPFIQCVVFDARSPEFGVQGARKAPNKIK